MSRDETDLQTDGSETLSLATSLSAPSETGTWLGFEDSGPVAVDVREADPARLPLEVEGRYDEVGEIGRGGMGRVVLARDVHLGRNVAIKELMRGNPTSRERFLREAQVTAQLAHPGILPVHELGRREDGTLFYAMKQVRGRTLTYALSDAKSLQDRLALLGHFVDLCQAVAYAHDKGVVHRDLKPDNVMIGTFGETLVIDWGLAKVAGAKAPEPDDDDPEVSVSSLDVTRAGTTMGTPAYMSPEQVRGEDIDVRADVWSLGVILYELLSGRRPFVADGLDALLAVVEEATPIPILEHEPGAPPALAAVAERAMRRYRARRYPNASELAAELEAWRNGHQVRAYQYSRRERIELAVAARPLQLVAGLLAVGLVAMGALAWSNAAETDALEAQIDDMERMRVVARLTAAGDPSALLFAREVEDPTTAPDWGWLTLRALAEWPVPADFWPSYRPVHHLAIDPVTGAATIGLRSDTRQTVSVGPDGLDESIIEALHVINGLAYTPDGEWLVAGGRGLSVLAARGGAARRDLADDSAFFSAVALSPDGGRVLAGTRKGAVHEYSLAGGEPTVRELGTEVTAVAIAVDGNRIAGHADGSVTLWTPEDEAVQTLSAAVSGGVRVLATHPSLPRLAIGGADGTVHVFADGALGEATSHADCPTEVVDLAWHPTDPTLLIGCRHRVGIRQSPEHDAMVISGRGPFHAVGFGPRGDRAYAGTGHGVWVWQRGQAGHVGARLVNRDAKLDDVVGSLQFGAWTSDESAHYALIPLFGETPADGEGEFVGNMSAYAVRDGRLELMTYGIREPNAERPVPWLHEGMHPQLGIIVVNDGRGTPGTWADAWEPLAAVLERQLWRMSRICPDSEQRIALFGLTEAEAAAQVELCRAQVKDVSEMK